jgi:hypothetical protein
VVWSWAVVTQFCVGLTTHVIMCRHQAPPNSATIGGVGFMS